MKALIAALLLITGTAAGAAWADRSVDSSRVIPSRVDSSRVIPSRIVLPIHHNLSRSAIPVCYDFGCKRRATVNLPEEEWRSVIGWFFPAAATPAGEREQIKNAIGWMEVVIGRHTPTHKDLAFDLPSGDHDDGIFPGQLDCIDEAVNTTSYLKLFAKHGLLKHHQVLEAAYRRSLFDQHWAGQVREKPTGKRFIIDSWFQPNGYLPVVQDGARWQDISLLSAVIDNRPDEEGEKVKRSWWHRFLRGE